MKMEMAMKTEMKLANFSMFFLLLTRVKIKNKKKTKKSKTTYFDPGQKLGKF